MKTVDSSLSQRLTWILAVLTIAILVVLMILPRVEQKDDAKQQGKSITSHNTAPTTPATSPSIRGGTRVPRGWKESATKRQHRIVEDSREMMINVMAEMNADDLDTAETFADGDLEQQALYSRFLEAKAQYELENLKLTNMFTPDDEREMAERAQRLGFSVD